MQPSPGLHLITEGNTPKGTFTGTIKENCDVDYRLYTNVTPLELYNCTDCVYINECLCSEEIHMKTLSGKETDVCSLLSSLLSVCSEKVGNGKI